MLYEYVPNPQGLMMSSLGTDRYWSYKFAALRNRKAIAARIGEDVLVRFGASIVFSAIELFKARKGFRRYAEDPLVAQAFRLFPISWRHPLAAAAVLGLRGVVR